MRVEILDCSPDPRALTDWELVWDQAALHDFYTTELSEEFSDIAPVQAGGEFAFID